MPKSKSNSVGRPAKPADEKTFCGQIGARIQRARLKRRLLVQEAAELAGVAVVSWYKWEKGDRLRLEALPAIAAALKIKPRELLP